jgi:hypothetical protein
MGILDSVIKLFVGDKQEKDLKLLQPVVDNVKKFEAEIAKLSHDELRAKTLSFKEQIKEATKTLDEKITVLEAEAKAADIDRQEDIYTEIQRPKIEEFDNYIFFSVKSLLPGTGYHLHQEQISFTLGQDFLISFQEKPADHFTEVRERIEHKKGRIED